MMIGTEQGPRDRVRDQRIDKIVELASPATPEAIYWALSAARSATGEAP